MATGNNEIWKHLRSQTTFMLAEKSEHKMRVANAALAPWARHVYSFRRYPNQ